VRYLLVIDVSEVEELDQTVGHAEKVVQCEDHHTVVINEVFFLVKKVGFHRVLEII
jgi:hypothetical protein